jgi:squalene cyclase
MHRAAAFLVERQDGSSGGWAKEALVGVFNRTCLIDYDNYRQYFPLWALSEYLGPGTSSA